MAENSSKLMPSVPPTASSESSKLIPTDDATAEETSRNKLKIDVGGRLFSTTMSTLESRDVGNRLAKEMSVYVKHSDAVAKPLFIDRDPTNFGHVLNYLREGDRTVLPDKRETLQPLLLEADYYGLRGLHKLIHSKLSVQPCVVWPNEKDAVSFKYIVGYINSAHNPDSFILPEAQEELQEIHRHATELDIGKLRDVLRPKLGLRSDYVMFAGDVRVKRETGDKILVIIAAVIVVFLAIMVVKFIRK